MKVPKIEVVQIGDKKYPMSGGMAVFEMAQGDDLMKEWKKKIMGANTRKALDLIYASIVAGCEYVNYFHLHPAGVELDANGKIQPMPRSVFALLLQDSDDLNQVFNALKNVLEMGGEKQINAQPIRTQGKKKKKKR